MNWRKLPKVELHRHLELSLRRSTIEELAPSIGIHIRSDADYKKHFLIDEPMSKLSLVLNKFLDTQKLLRSKEILERIAFEACEDAVGEGIELLELRYAPTFVRMGHEDLSFQDIHDAFVRGLQRAQKQFSLRVGLICIIQRILPVAEAEKVVDFAVDNKDTFIGLDLADNEEGFDSKPFSPFFLKAKKAGLGITVHAGEANLPKAPRYPKDAIEVLYADRIGHGVQIYRDPEMIKYVIDRGVTLELCPTSNYLTQAVPSLEAHPFVQLTKAGVKTTINTDDPGIFGIDLVHEYDLLHRLHGLSEADFRAANARARAASFLRD
jgi:adenosine deaminase